MSQDTQSIVKLRSLTGAGIVDCQKALQEGGNDFEKAVELLRKKGQKVAANKQERETKEGLIYSYIHAGGRVGVLVELLCETDFVARNDEFKQLAHDIALHIAAMNPLVVSQSDVAPGTLEKEKEIYREQMKDEKKPQEILEKIIEGKIAKYYQEVCLLNQQFVKDDTLTIQGLIERTIGKIGENIKVGRFTRYSL